MKTLVVAYLFVALGGALGAMARFGLNLALQRDTNYPWGTLASNLFGCFVMGAVAYLVANSNWFNSAGLIPDQYRLLFAVGFCGSFTTLSSLVLEMNTMLQKGDVMASFSYFSATMIGSFICFYLGYLAIRPLVS